MNYYRRALPVCCLTGLALAATAVASAQDLPRGTDLPVFEGIDLSNRGDEQDVRIIIEEGSVSPPQTLLTLDAPQEVVLKITSGPAQFLYATEKGKGVKAAKRVRYTAAEVLLPSISPGGRGESYLSIFIDGIALGDPIGIGIVEREIFDLLPVIPAMRAAILLYDATQRYYIIDPSRLDLALPLTPDDGRPWPPPGEGVGSQVPDDTNPPEPGIDLCSLEVWLEAPLGVFLPRLNCLLNVLPTGRAIWNGMQNPQAIGYSVKPEAASTLAWATAPENYGIDGVYKIGWGCDRALKVPDYCTVNAFPAGASCCCGLVAVALNRNCSWIATIALPDWPNCPLGL